MNFMYYIRRSFEKLTDVHNSVISRLRLLLWGVKIGKNLKFSGRIFIKRYPGSSISIGEGCQFLSAFHSNQIGLYSRCSLSTLNPNASICIGNKCGFSGTVIASTKGVKIGNNVRCGANTLIVDTDFHTDDSRAGFNKEVVIEDDVWLGYGVKVLKGVHIGKGALIGAMSVVTKDISAGVMAAGNPCKEIRSLST